MSGKIINREIGLIEKEILLGKYKTALKKNDFINEIKSGLGKKIDKNPGRVKVIQKTTLQKIRVFFKVIFTKF